MLIKPMPAADPTKVCRTCSHYDPDLEVCCANDVVVSSGDAEIKSCDSWNPKHICITCGHFDPDTNECWFEEHDMSEEGSLTRTCESWEPKKEKSAGWDHQLEAKALDRGAKQGMTLEALETVFAVACQQVPSMAERWMELKAEINLMFARKWAAEDMPE